MRALQLNANTTAVLDMCSLLATVRKRERRRSSRSTSHGRRAIQRGCRALHSLVTAQVRAAKPARAAPRRNLTSLIFWTVCLAQVSRTRALHRRSPEDVAAQFRDILSHSSHRKRGLMPRLSIFIRAGYLLLLKGSV